MDGGEGSWYLLTCSFFKNTYPVLPSVRHVTQTNRLCVVNGRALLMEAIC
jgi:hypothetical protein